MSASAIAQLVVAGTVIASFTLGGLAWLITPRLVDTIERTVNGKIDRLNATVDANATEATSRYDAQRLHQSEMFGEIRVAAERHKNVLAAIDHISAEVSATAERAKDNAQRIAEHQDQLSRLAGMRER